MSARRALVGCLASLTAFCACCSQAFGFSFPSGATASPLCPTFPGDVTSGTASPVVAPYAAIAATTSSWTYGATGAWGGGTMTVTTYTNSGIGGQQVGVFVQDTGNHWDLVATVQPEQVNGVSVQTWQVATPAGPVRLGAYSPSGATTIYAGAAGADVTQAGTVNAQGLSVLCDASQAASSQAHSDAQQLDGDLGQLRSGVAPLDGDLGAVKSAVNGLTANGTTLDTLNGDLATVETELTTLDQDVRASGSGAGGGSGTTTGATTQEVVLSPADRQLLADTSNTEHQGLWDLGGMALGLFCASRLGRLWSV